MARDSCAGGDGNPISKDGTSGNPCISADKTTLSHLNIVSDLDEVVNFSAIPDDGATKRGPINGAICANLNIIFDHNISDLRNLSGPTGSIDISKPVGPNDSSTVNNTPGANHNTR